MARVLVGVCGGISAYKACELVRLFVKDGHEVKLSTPSVISGGEYEMTVCSLPDTLTLLFETENECFTVSLYLETDN